MDPVADASPGVVAGEADTPNRERQAKLETIMTKKRVLFICTHNSARSQIAEAWLKRVGRDAFEVESAGLEPGTLKPVVVEAMREVDIDLSSKGTQPVRLRGHTLRPEEGGAMPGFPRGGEAAAWGCSGAPQDANLQGGATGARAGCAGPD